MSTLTVGTIKSNSTSPPAIQNSSGIEIGTLCRAWVNFNGTLTSPITPRSSFNVGSVTKNSTGDYTINFTNSMPDANYSITFGGGDTGGTAIMALNTLAASSVRFQVYNATPNLQDRPFVTVAVFR